MDTRPSTRPTQGGETLTNLASRARTLFERKLMADYRNTFRGELGRTQAEVLEYLYEYGEARPVRIAEAIHAPKQHVSKIVAHLQEAALVSMRSDEKDRRSRVVALTGQGRAYLDAHIARSNEIFLARVNRLSPAERDELCLALSALAALLEKI